jgi:hypothetical protein
MDDAVDGGPAEAVLLGEVDQGDAPSVLYANRLAA